MRKFLFLSIFISYLAFGQNNIVIKEKAQENQTQQSTTIQPSQNQECPNKNAVQDYLISHNLASYTLLGIIPSNSVPGYCNIILQGDNNQKFFIRIRHDLAYVIAGSVINTTTNKVVIPNMQNFNTKSP